MDKKGQHITKIILDVLGFILILGGSLLVRYNPNDKISIIGGILVAIGVGLLSLSRTV
ncbi:MAG: hypothetical protein AABX29_06490 [Nanoarchaeota archaeon]